MFESPPSKEGGDATGLGLVTSLSRRVAYRINGGREKFPVVFKNLHKKLVSMRKQTAL